MTRCSRPRPFETALMRAWFCKSCRLLNQAISLHYRTWAKSAGFAAAETGAVTFVHRFGSSLNLHTHFLVACAKTTIF
jgi:hypothetical protein